MDAKPSTDVSQNATTLPAYYYVDADHHHREVDRVFGHTWSCVGRADELPEVGDHAIRELGDESLIIVRASPGRINAFYNVCRHRGTRICEGTSGHALRLQCPYHAWTYGLDGALLAAPHFEEGDRFRKADLGLKGVACETWDGLVFINPDEHAAPFRAGLGDLPERFASWGMGSLRCAARVIYDVAANWKLIVQNYSECLHCPVIHPVLQKVSHYLSGENDPYRPEASYLGGRMKLREEVATMSFDGHKRRADLPGLDASARRHVYYYAILPNLLLSLHPDYVMTHVLRPIAVDRTEVVCEWHFHPDEMARADFDPSDAVGFWDLTNRQDWHVSELTQLGLKSRAYTPGPYSDREELLVAFDRWIISRLTES